MQVLIWIETVSTDLHTVILQVIRTLSSLQSSCIQNALQQRHLKCSLYENYKTVQLQCSQYQCIKISCMHVHNYVRKERNSYIHFWNMSARSIVKIKEILTMIEQFANILSKYIALEIVSFTGSPLMHTHVHSCYLEENGFWLADDVLID